MRELFEVAAQLRKARKAHQQFLRLWAMEQALVHPALDRMAADVDADDGFAGPIPEFGLNDEADADDEG